MIVWLTGQSGAGKTTIAERLITDDWINLDGDAMRESISEGAGFSVGDRMEHNRRVARLAKVLNQQTNVIVSVIAPTEKIREAVNVICKPTWVYIKRDVPKREGHIYEEPKDVFTLDHNVLSILESDNKLRDHLYEITINEKAISFNDWQEGMKDFKGYRKSQDSRDVILRERIKHLVLPFFHYRPEIVFDFREFTGKVLDVGCGSRNKYFFPNAEYTGIDPIEKDNIEMGVFNGVGENIKAEDNNFDKVVCISVLQHVFNPKKVMKEMRRVLISGGRIYMTVYFDELGGYVTYEFNKKSVIDLALKTDFKIVHSFENNKSGYYILEKP